MSKVYAGAWRLIGSACDNAAEFFYWLTGHKGTRGYRVVSHRLPDLEVFCRCVTAQQTPRPVQAIVDVEG